MCLWFPFGVSCLPFSTKKTKKKSIEQEKIQRPGNMYRVLSSTDTRNQMTWETDVDYFRTGLLYLMLVSLVMYGISPTGFTYREHNHDEGYKHTKMFRHGSFLLGHWKVFFTEK